MRVDSAMGDELTGEASQVLEDQGSRAESSVLPRAGPKGTQNPREVGDPIRPMKMSLKGSCERGLHELQSAVGLWMICRRSMELDAKGLVQGAERMGVN